MGALTLVVRISRSWLSPVIPLFQPNGESAPVNGNLLSHSTKPVLTQDLAKALFVRSAYYKDDSKDGVPAATIKVAFELGKPTNAKIQTYARQLLNACAWSYQAYQNSGANSLYLYSAVPLYDGQSRKIIVRNPDAGILDDERERSPQNPFEGSVKAEDALRSIWIARKHWSLEADIIAWTFATKYSDPDPLRADEPVAEVYS